MDLLKEVRTKICSDNKNEKSVDNFIHQQYNKYVGK